MQLDQQLRIQFICPKINDNFGRFGERSDYFWTYSQRRNLDPKRDSKFINEFEIRQWRWCRWKHRQCFGRFGQRQESMLIGNINPIR